MASADRLREALVRLPAEALVPVGWVRGQLDDGQPEHVQAELLNDMTIDEVARMLNRSPSTVRSWCNTELLKGAYKLRKREWRIPPVALSRFLDAQRAQEGSGTVRQRGDVTLSGWRRHVTTAA